MRPDLGFLERFEWAAHVFLAIILFSFLAYMVSLLRLSLADTVGKIIAEFRELFRLEVTPGSLNAMGIIMYCLLGGTLLTPEIAEKLIIWIREEFGDLQAAQADQSLTPFYFLIGIGGFTLISVFFLKKVK